MTDHDAAKQAVLGEIEKENTEWALWLSTLRAEVVKARSKNRFCMDGVRDVFMAAGMSANEARAYGDGGEIPASATQQPIEASHYTAEGLQAMVLRPARDRHAAAKLAVRDFALRNVRSGEIRAETFNDAAPALGFTPLAERMKVDISSVYFTWWQNGDADRTEIERKLLEALESLVPEGGEVNMQPGGGAYIPEVRVQVQRVIG